MVKHLLQKGCWTEMDYVNFILEASASSARFGLIKENEGSDYHKTRANIHAALILPFGAGKTSSFVGIKDAVYAFDVSFPGLIGTINKDGEVVESAIMKAGGKVLIIDEFQRLPTDVKESLCSILEYPHVYSRTLGYKIKSNVNKRGKYFYIKAKQGSNKFDVYSKFSCIGSGMYISKKTSVDRAFFSRFVPIRFTPTIDYYIKLSRGEKLIKINPTYKEMDFVFEDYLAFNDYYWNAVRNSPHITYFEKMLEEAGWLVRCLQDLIRIAAFVESLDDRNTISLDNAKFVCDKFLDFMMINYKTGSLNENDLFIITNLTLMSQAEIAKKLGISQAAVSQRIDFLRKLGLIK